MSHWAMEYLGQPWTPERNCYYWFRRIMVEQFGHDGLPPVAEVNEKGSVRVAMRALTDESVKRYGWIPTEVASEGGAVFLTEGTRSSHLGVATYIKGKLLIIHACKNTGVVLSDTLALKVNNLRITGHWAYENIL